jgi:hypothetical protein
VFKVSLEYIFFVTRMQLLLCVVQHKVSNQFFQEAAMDALERDLVIGNSTSGFLAANLSPGP